MTKSGQQKNAGQRLYELEQFVPSSFCYDECRGCCVFMESYWLPRVLLAEQEQVGHPAICLGESAGVKRCQFLDPGPHHCQIYATRPFECRLYPFLLIRRQNTLDLAAHLGCPYVVRHLKTDRFTVYSRTLSSFLSREPIRATLRREQDKFHTYPDIELFLVRRDVLRASGLSRP